MSKLFNTEEVITWNTGRLYQADGQIIKAVVIDSTHIAFVDCSRNLDGIIEHQGLGADEGNESVLTRYVMTAYDNGFYRTARSDVERDMFRAIIAFGKGNDHG